MPEEDAPKKRRPIEIGAEAEPIKLGSMLLTLVEPHRGHEVAYNRWYERDHFYAGCMIGPYNSPAGASWPRPSSRPCATPTRRPSPASPDRGTFVAVYWVLDGYYDVWNRWALRQVKALHTAGRMFDERDHVHTLLYRYEWEHRRDPDGVPAELALDHPSAASSPCSPTATTSVPTRSCGRGCAPSTCPRCCRGPTPTWWPRSRRSRSSRRARRRAPRGGRRQPHRAVVVLQHAARGGVGARHRRAPAPLEEAGKGTVVAALPVHPDHPGHRHLHRQALGRLSAPTRRPAGQPRARISTWGTTKTASSGLRPAQRTRRRSPRARRRRSARTRPPARRSGSSAPGRPTARPTRPVPRGRRRSTSSSRRSTSANPAAWARPSRRGPIRASWPLRSVTARYSSSQRSSMRVRRGPGEGPVVRVAGGQHATGAQHAAQLDQGGHGVGEMLEHLVQVDHVEGGVGVAEREEVAHLEAQVLEAQPARRAPAPGPPRRRRRRARPPRRGPPGGPGPP